MKLSEQTQIEAQIGFTIGILIGAIAAGIFILFFTTWEWYFKMFSVIGSLGIIGSLILSLAQLFKARQSYIIVKKEMDNMKQNSVKAIGAYTG